MSGQIIWQARLDTQHFDFEAFGSSAAQARSALCTGIRRHCEQRQVSVVEFQKAYEGEIETRRIELGAAYRDRETL